MRDFADTLKRFLSEVVVPAYCCIDLMLIFFVIPSGSALAAAFWLLDTYFRGSQ